MLGQTVVTSRLTGSHGVCLQFQWKQKVLTVFKKTEHITSTRTFMHDNKVEHFGLILMHSE